MTYGELSDAFMALLTKHDALHIEHAQTLRELNSAREKIARIMSGLEGCCMTCEPVGVRNQQMERDIATLKAARDEARREVCALEADTSEDQREFARQRGWDCWPETTP